MTKIISLKGKIKNYDWGGSGFIPDLLGFNSDGKRYAEYWMGAHKNAPSEIITEKGEQTLDAFLNNDLSKNLGTSIADKFGRLPFLFKVLDVQNMLSIQVHPTKLEAEKGFALENDKGIPLNAAHRNYKDDNHKPEIMVALGEFWLLHGFLPSDGIFQILSEVSEFEGLLSIFLNEGYKGLYKQVMEQSVEEDTQILRPLMDRIRPLYKTGKLTKSDPDYWAAKSRELVEEGSVFDKGIFSIYFFNLVKLGKGEAIFQDAGVPHSYLEGQNIELMANSDNVLRAGLTSKHIDIPELLKHVSFVGTVPRVMQGELQTDGMERIFRSPAPDFELSQIELTDSKTYHSNTTTAQILLNIDGRVEIKEGSSSMVLEKGDAAFISADTTYQISSATSATLYKASTP